MDDPSQKPATDLNPTIKCPFCPVCGAEPPFIFDSMYQAFCPNEDCEVLMWVPWETAKANLDDMHEAVITETPPD